MSDQVRRPPVADWATDFDHYADDYIDDPHVIHAEARAQCPVAHSDRYGGVVVPLTYEHNAAVAHDTETFTSRRIVVSETPTDRRGIILPPINLDPPDHTEPRRAMLPFFNPTNVRYWEPTIREICKRHLDAFSGDRVDLAGDYAKHVPGDLTARMFGVPPSEADQFRTWVYEILEVGPTDLEVERRATNEVVAYMRGLIDERRDQPRGDDFVSYLFDQEIDGEPISDEAMAKMLLLLLVAGIDTTWSALGASFWHLANHDEDRQRLVDDPSLIPVATEELLRAYGPVTVARIATKDTELGGCPVAAGEWVMLNLLAANRDPEVFDDPDEVIIDRTKNRHAAFGLGVHRCLGSNLARIEMHIAIEMLLERYPNFSAVPGADPEWSAGTVRGPRSVPVILS